jgi:hypothetical protein
MEWLNGAGLVCNLLGVLAIFRFGVPYFRPVADAGKSFLLLEADDPAERSRVTLAASLSRAGLLLLLLGFALQLTAVLVS